MCGRYTLTKRERRLTEKLGIPADDIFFPPRYNIAPTQDATVLVDQDGPKLKLMRWGLIPFWAKDQSIGNKMINARAETIAEKPAFKRLLQRQRCLVLADGFYEWKKAGTVKLPVRFTLKSGDVFAFAGLWDRWKAAEGGPEIESFTIVTTEPNALCRTVHDRMPVILPLDRCEQWLDPEQQDIAVLQPWLCAYPADEMASCEVSRLVNNPRNDVPACAEPLPSLPGLAETPLFERDTRLR